MSRLTELIMKHEEFRPKVYDDATGESLKPGMTLIGHPTIGYGRALDVNGVDEEEADFLLLNDITQVTEHARQFTWFERLNEPRQAVVISMIYNLGFTGFSSFYNTIAALSLDAYDRAAKEMLDSEWAQQVGTRAAQLAVMMRSGVWLD